MGEGIHQAVKSTIYPTYDLAVGILTTWYEPTPYPVLFKTVFSLSGGSLFTRTIQLRPQPSFRSCLHLQMQSWHLICWWIINEANHHPLSATNTYTSNRNLYAPKSYSERCLELKETSSTNLPISLPFEFRMIPFS